MTARPLRVMLISPDFGSGGAERSIAKLSFLLGEFCEVHFVVFNDAGKMVYPVTGTLHYLQVSAGKNPLEKLLRLRQRIQRARKLKRDLSIDVSISFLEGADYVNTLSREKDKVILSVRGAKEADKQISGLTGWLRRRLLMPFVYRRADLIVAVSEGIKLELQRTIPLSANRIKVIPNYYDIAAIQRDGSAQLPAFASPLYDVPVVAVSGRLHPQKNVEGILHVAVMLKKVYGDPCRVMILGDGEMLEGLRKLCGALGLSHSVLGNGHLDNDADVVFLGYQKNPWMFISRARVFFLGSSWEGFPNALAEAMCLGVPVVSTNCPHGPDEILTGTILSRSTVTWTEAGVLIPLLEEEKAFRTAAEVLHKIISGEQTPITKNGGVSRMKSFSYERASAEWRNAIDGL